MTNIKGSCLRVFGGNMASTTESDVLDTVDEDFIRCKICDQQFESPKILPCRHTFCEWCIAGLVDRASLTCPECGLTYEVPKGGVSAIEPNIFMMEFLETVQQASEVAEIKCEGCNENPATFMCTECKQSLCYNCVKVHRNLSATQTHSLIALTDTKKSSSLMTHKTNRMCSVHTRNEVKSYCKTCDNLVCSDCILEVCKAGHSHKDIEDAANEYRQQLTAVVNNLTLDQQDADRKKTAANLQAYVELKERRKTDEHMVRMKAAEIIEKIRKEEERLVDKLMANYQMKMSMANTDMTVFKIKHNNIKQICNVIKMLTQNENAVKLLLTKGAIESELEIIRSTPLEVQKVNFEEDNLNEGMIASLLMSAAKRDSSDKSESHGKMKMAGALPAFSRTVRSTSTVPSKFKVNADAQQYKDFADVAKCKECHMDKLHGKFSQGTPNQIVKPKVTGDCTGEGQNTRAKLLSDQDGQGITTCVPSFKWAVQSDKAIRKHHGGEIIQPAGQSLFGRGQSAAMKSAFCKQPSHWTCQRCAKSNTSDKVRCVACGTGMPGGKDNQNTPIFGSTIKSNDGRDSTVTLTSVLDSDTRQLASQVGQQPCNAARTSLQSKQPASNWACKMCPTFNTSDKVRCVTCSANKPENKDKKSKHSSRVKPNASSGRLIAPTKDDSTSKAKQPTTRLSFGQVLSNTTNSSSVFEEHTGFWTCQTCSTRNMLDKSTGKCFTCGMDKTGNQSSNIHGLAIKPNVSTGMTTTPKTKNNQTKPGGFSFQVPSNNTKSSPVSTHPSGFWTCQICSTCNKSDKSKCLACGKDKTGRKIIKAATFMG